jgi:hypothetical protein
VVLSPAETLRLFKPFPLEIVSRVLHSSLPEALMGGTDHRANPRTGYGALCDYCEMTAARRVTKGFWLVHGISLDEGIAKKRRERGKRSSAAEQSGFTSHGTAGVTHFRWYIAA